MLSKRMVIVQFEAGARVINYYNAVATHIRQKFGDSAVIVTNRHESPKL